jgi:hypothetical protein
MLKNRVIYCHFYTDNKAEQHMLKGIDDDFNPVVKFIGTASVDANKEYISNKNCV